MSLFYPRDYHRDRMGNCCSRFSASFNPGRNSRGYDNERDRGLPLINSASLLVQKVELNLEKNAIENNTDKYEVISKKFSPCLVIRRGSNFRIRLTFQRNFRKDDDLINFVFTLKDAKKPSYSQFTEITVPVSDENSNTLSSITSFQNTWNAKIVFAINNNVVVEMTSSPTCIIGEWSLSVDTKSRSGGHGSLIRYKTPEPVYIIFNPWSKKDDVFMKDKEGRNEYVLNENGLLWRGTHSLMRPTAWNFAQFEEVVLKASLLLLNKNNLLPVSDRNDPVKVTRHISAIVNSNDDNGVVVGLWKEDYTGGKPPTSWGGSLAILQQYYKSRRPVKFGQCWVFAAVCATICRCLGIPARVVTNFLSAHDTHKSLTVDRFFDDDGEPVDAANTDSIWNFHVWTEVWMARPDLSTSTTYDGWQVIDATPQEPSDGVFRCGPTSVEAVRRGEILKHYDGMFVYAEVNADELYWLHQGDKQPFKLIGHKSSSIGKKISTKVKGAMQREDITDNYKAQEHSLEERQVMIKALRLCKNQFARYYLNEKFEDVKFDFILIDDIVIGQPFSVKLNMLNKSSKVYTINAIIVVRTTLYTGQTHSVVKKERKEIKLAPKSDENFLINIRYDEYAKHLVDQSSFSISVMANVLETDFQYYAMDDFRVRMPDINIETHGDMIQGKPFTCILYLRNPLPKVLTKAYFTVEGPGLGFPLKMPIKGAVQPKSEARVSFSLIPKTSGEKTISAKFVSRELHDIDGFKNIRVAPNIRPRTNENDIDDDFY